MGENNIQLKLVNQVSLNSQSSCDSFYYVMPLTILCKIKLLAHQGQCLKDEK